MYCYLVKYQSRNRNAAHSNVTSREEQVGHMWQVWIENRSDTVEIMSPCSWSMSEWGGWICNLKATTCDFLDKVDHSWLLSLVPRVSETVAVGWQLGFRDLRMTLNQPIYQPTLSGKLQAVAFNAGALKNVQLWLLFLPYERVNDLHVWCLPTRSLKQEFNHLGNVPIRFLAET